MKKATVSITKEGKAELEKELKALIDERPVLAERIATAREFGDLSENEEYSSARKEQNTAESRIAEIQEILKNAKVIRSRAGSSVTLGSTVKVKTGRKEIIYNIVGPVEADPLSGKISNESPIGKALLGHKVGEVAELKLPKGVTKYHILEIM
jgi:transcription elongation factor GreA